MTGHLMAAAFLLGTVAASAAHAEIKTQAVEYKHGDTVLEGYLAYDDAVAKPDHKRPAVLVVHEWWGCNDYAKQRARDIAALGYVAFAVDMYGKGKTTQDPKEAGAWAGAIRKDPKLSLERINLALDLVRKNERVNAQRIAAIGYCFGGSVVLDLARSGADLAAVVSFHGGLATTNPAQPGKIKAKVLVCHGADDPHVPAADVAAFQEEMRKTGADWQLIAYGGAVHAFTNPASGNAKMDGVGYNEKADHRSWAAMKEFLGEAFK